MGPRGHHDVSCQSIIVCIICTNRETIIKCLVPLRVEDGTDKACAMNVGTTHSSSHRTSVLTHLDLAQQKKVCHVTSTPPSLPCWTVAWPLDSTTPEIAFMHRATDVGFLTTFYADPTHEI